MSGGGKPACGIAVLGAACVIALAGITSPARAQTSTTGAIRGVVADSGTAVPIAGVTIVATSPALQGSQTAVSDVTGRYTLTALPPGEYLLSFYYGDLVIERRGIAISIGRLTTVNQTLDTQQAGGEVIRIRERGSSVDTASTQTGTHLTQRQLRNIPIPGRTFDTAINFAAGADQDSTGVAFSGSTSLENQYIVDGVNTTGLTFGTVGTPLINEFIEEIQVVTGGYQAEYGRATGAVVNVVTKQGSNEFHGSVFATAVPFQVSPTAVRRTATSIDDVRELDYRADFGFELGGPVIQDKLWFYVGFAPQFSQTDIGRVVQRQMDCHGIDGNGEMTDCDPAFADGIPDEDPRTGDVLFEQVDRSSYKGTEQVYQFVSKFNYAYDADHQGQVSIVGVPITGQGVFAVAGSERATRADFQGLSTDVAGKWTSKFQDNKTEIQALFGWHRTKFDQDALDDTALADPSTQVFRSNLDRFGTAGGESARVMQGCRDSGSGDDPYPLIENCPFTEYWLDSPGFVVDNREDRQSGRLTATRRMKMLGDHVFKGGFGVELNRTRDIRRFTGGRLYQVVVDPNPSVAQARVLRLVNPSGAGDVCGFELDENGNVDFNQPRPCEYLERETVDSETLNWAAFLQDSWQVIPNLTLNVGLRYEEQRLRYNDAVRDTVDPFTGERRGKNALTLRGLFAPRAGVVYDPTKEGRSKLYASYGRFYESVPLLLNDFSFSGTTLYAALFSFDQCDGTQFPSHDTAGQVPNPRNCPDVGGTTTPSGGDVYRGGATVVAPGTTAQHLDEWTLGAEYEVIEDLTVGIAYRDRRLRRVLENVSIDARQTFIVGNPGRFSPEEEDRLQSRIDALDPADPERARLEAQLEGFRSLRRFEVPRRDYQALELTAVRRFSRDFYAQLGYTLSRTRGNYPGLVNGDTGDPLPHISTQYDLAELLANRTGLLPQDRPHNLRVEGFYTWRIPSIGNLTTGLRFRAFSGTPVDTLAGHFLFGSNESFLLARGSQGRTPFVTSTDVHIGYTRPLDRGYELQVFMDVINLFNQEQASLLDRAYTLDNASAIVGGTREDLVFAKKINALGNETGEPVARNIGFGTPLTRFAPLLVRFGARFTF